MNDNTGRRRQSPPQRPRQGPRQSERSRDRTRENVITASKIARGKILKTSKEARKEIAADMRYMLSKGDKVRVNHHRLNGKTLTVEKVNRVKAVLRESSKGPSWTVPLSMIEPVEFKVDLVQLEQGRRVA